MKGIGKTAFLSHCAVYVVPELTILAKEIQASPSKSKMAMSQGSDKVKAKAAYFTFNGSGASTRLFNNSLNQNRSRPDYSTAFGHVLLVACGIEWETVKDMSFETSLELFRLVMQMGQEESLVIFVDEVGQLDDTDAAGLLHYLMSEMDARRGKLIFVFAHILQTFLNKMATGSGRTVTPIPLFGLHIDAWMTLLGEAVEKAAAKHSGIRQLLLSCCGHPRAICEGVPKACEQPDLLQAPSEAQLVLARQTISRQCKFEEFLDRQKFDGISSVTSIGELIQQWFDIYGQVNAQVLARDGLLLRIDGDGKTNEGSVHFLSPILMQTWADSADSKLAFHLRQAYAADAFLTLGTEKKMEDLLFHFEAVLRVSLAGQCFFLKDFYNTKHLSQELGLTTVRAELPSGNEVVVRVDNFADMTRISVLLKSGFIVVSNLQAEAGIEYLSGYLTDDDKLLVAATQCKFVQTRMESWNIIKDKMTAAMEALQKHGIPYFNVIYTTVDQQGLQPQTYANSVIFTEQDMFEFTSKLGPLRLHTEKLGKFTSKQHPWLGRICSESGPA